MLLSHIIDKCYFPLPIHSHVVYACFQLPFMSSSPSHSCHSLHYTLNPFRSMGTVMLHQSNKTRREHATCCVQGFTSRQSQDTNIQYQFQQPHNASQAIIPYLFCAQEYKYLSSTNFSSTVESIVWFISPFVIFLNPKA